MLGKDALLYLSRNRWARNAAQRYGLRFGAKRFVAGESIFAAIETVRELNRHGIEGTLDHLGEFVTREEDAAELAETCIRTLTAIRDSGVRSHLSVKLTQLGLDIAPQLCLAHMERIVDHAGHCGTFVRIDMEDYARNDTTLKLFEQLHDRFGNAVGVVIQAYLYKSEADVLSFGERRPNLRLVKGAYKESAEVAFPLKADVDRNLIRLTELHLLQGGYAAVATHDERIIEHVKRFVREREIPNDRFEFQMLYGIRPQLQLQLVEEGYRMRVYVPFGRDWYGYFMRRLAERPANVVFVLKSLFKS